MVKIRLSRAGGKKKPFYRVVATDSRSPRDGRFLEQLGTYDPRKDPPAIRLDAARVDHWLHAGARPSPTVKVLIRRSRRDAAAAAA
jgi:small subunit ribosomal protein S16